MLRTAITTAAVFQIPSLLSASVPRRKCLALALFLSSWLVFLPVRGHTAGLDCPEMGPGAVPNLLSDLQLKLVTTGSSVDLANEPSVEKPS
jgi:hypothetical protein